MDEHGADHVAVENDRPRELQISVVEGVSVHNRIDPICRRDVFVCSGDICERGGLYDEGMPESDDIVCHKCCCCEQQLGDGREQKKRPELMFYV